MTRRSPFSAPQLQTFNQALNRLPQSDRLLASTGNNTMLVCFEISSTPDLGTPYRGLAVQF